MNLKIFDFKSVELNANNININDKWQQAECINEKWETWKNQNGYAQRVQHKFLFVPKSIKFTNSNK